MTGTTSTQRYPYASIHWKQRVVHDHLADGGDATLDAVVEALTLEIRRAEPGISQRVSRQPCPWCGYAFGWLQQSGTRAWSSCWSCGRRVHAARRAA